MRMHVQANLARFLRMAAAYKRRLKFKGQLLLEPKPQVRPKGLSANSLPATVGAAWCYAVVRGLQLFAKHHEPPESGVAVSHMRPKPATTKRSAYSPMLA